MAKRVLVAAFLLLLTTLGAANASRCENWEKRPKVAMTIGSQVYVVFTGSTICVDRWLPQAAAFEKWFSSPNGAEGELVSIQFRTAQDAELLTSARIGVYSLTRLHFAPRADQTSCLTLWTIEIDGLTSGAHALGNSRWFLPTANSGVLVTDGAIECTIKTDYKGGQPGNSGARGEQVAVVTGNELWRYVPACRGSLERHKRVSLRLAFVAGTRNGWLAIGIVEDSLKLFMVNDELKFVARHDLGLFDYQVELANGTDGAVISLPSSGIAYAYVDGRLRRMKIPKGFVACRSWTGTQLVFSDGRTVESPSEITSETWAGVTEFRIGTTTLVILTRDAWGRFLVLCGVLAAILAAAVYLQADQGRS